MVIHKIVTTKNEQAAKRQMFEQLFDDFYHSRGKVYRVNFMRGIFFGFGSILGGTVVVALMIWILGLLADWFPFIGDVIRDFINAIKG